MSQSGHFFVIFGILGNFIQCSAEISVPKFACDTRVCNLRIRICVLSVHAFPTRLISMYELAYCPLRVLILLLVLAAVHCKSMAR